MTFRDLLHLNKNEAEYAEAQRLLYVLLGTSTLNGWKLGGEIVSKGDRILLGVVTWSAYDLQMLESLDTAIRNDSLKRETTTIDVFDFSSCTSQEELDKYIPSLNIASVFHTPVVGWWTNGIFQWADSGGVVRKRVIALISGNH